MDAKKTDFIIRGIDTRVRKALKKEAEANKRSINSQLLVILEERYAKAKLAIEQ
jgi:hypothetical protein